MAEVIADYLGMALPEIEVLDFAKSGYLPSAILNYIALLGWNPKTEVERFDLPEFIERFTLEGIHKSNSTFDREKLFRFNAERIAALTPAAFGTRLAELACPCRIRTAVHVRRRQVAPVLQGLPAPRAHVDRTLPHRPVLCRRPRLQLRRQGRGEGRFRPGRRSGRPLGAIEDCFGRHA